MKVWSDEAPWMKTTKDSLSHADARGHMEAIGRRARGNQEFKVLFLTTRFYTGTAIFPLIRAAHEEKKNP